MDLAGEWSCHEILQRRLLHRGLVDRLQSFESMTWREIERDGKHHPMSHVAISAKARRRLAELPHVDPELLYSLRITQRRRLWGIRQGRVFRILWWDPEHTVYPMDIKNNKN